MGHWIYILSLDGGRYYVGETVRLVRRLAEHFGGRGGQCTHEHSPEGLVAVYPLPLEADAHEFENHMTLLMMRAMGQKYWLVQGGKYTDKFQPQNPSLQIDPDRPLCHCGVPSHVITCRNGGQLFVCPRTQSIWELMTEQTNFVLPNTTPCSFKKYSVHRGATFEYPPAVPEPSPQLSAKPPGVYAFIDSSRDVAKALCESYATSDRLSVTARCSAVHCLCHRSLVDVFDCDIDPADQIHVSIPEDDAYIVAIKTVDGSAKLSFGSSTSVGSQDHFVVTSLGSIEQDLENKTMLVEDQSGVHKEYTCMALDVIASKVPNLRFARANNMARCIGCGAFEYKAVKSEGGFLRLCTRCATDCDTMDRLRRSC
jgi:predicted GIY-YIG superfamily endonuclease